MFLSLLYGFYRGLDADTYMWQVSQTLFRFTINPDNSYYDQLERSYSGERIDSALTITSNVFQVANRVTNPVTNPESPRVRVGVEALVRGET